MTTPANDHGLLVHREDLGPDIYTLVAPGETVPAHFIGLPITPREAAPDDKPRTDLMQRLPKP
jgi:hypothetical protein